MLSECLSEKQSYRDGRVVPVLNDIIVRSIIDRYADREKITAERKPIGIEQRMSLKGFTLLSLSLGHIDEQTRSSHEKNDEFKAAGSRKYLSTVIPPSLHLLSVDET